MTLSATAAQYVPSPPLSAVVKSAVGPVREGTVLELPIITWGGDMGTIHANGDAVNTAQGSIFAKEGLNFKLVREDVLAAQIEKYLSGQTPYLRGTLGMINMAAEVCSRDPRTKPITVYQMTWSRGGDCLVVREGINAVKDLKGKIVVLQAYGPHAELLATVLGDAGLTMADVNIRWVKDLTGTAETPAEALRKDATVAACFVISPDAAALTSNGTVGNGSEQSVKGAKIMFSTRAASRIIADVYAVRADYFNAHRVEVGKFVHALLESEEDLGQLFANSTARKADYQKALVASAKVLLDSDQAIEDVKGLYGDCEFVGYPGNVKFFATPTEVRRFDAINTELQGAFIAGGLIGGRVALAQAEFDYEALKKGLTQTSLVEAPRFQVAEVAKIVDQKIRSGASSDGAIFSFEIYFTPNQNTFNAELYKTEFNQVIELAATYGGAIITVEGHSDPMAYVDKKASGSPELVLTRTRQSAKNLSLTRAIAVRESVLNFAKGKNVIMDPSQFAVVGHGFDRPKSGMVNGEPVRPKSDQEWKANMRVEFRLIPVGDTEAQVFTPAGGGK
jgi:ABC-type nitrate/sulfonate/bicarbonate transport system substrate-binding protein/outer membrane protein OmpA-like peptidoglycan-associated protein